MRMLKCLQKTWNFMMCIVIQTNIPEGFVIWLFSCLFTVKVIPDKMKVRVILITNILQICKHFIKVCRESSRNIFIVDKTFMIDTFLNTLLQVVWDLFSDLERKLFFYFPRRSCQIQAMLSSFSLCLALFCLLWEFKQTELFYLVLV